MVAAQDIGFSVDVIFFQLMKVYYQLTAQEIAIGLAKHRRVSNRLQVGLMLGIFGVLSLAIGSQLPTRQAGLFFVCGVLLLTIAFTLPLLMPWILRRTFFKLVSSNAVFTDPKTLEFDEDRLVFSSPGRRSEITWNTLIRLTQDEQYVYLHSDDIGTVTLIPKSAFNAADLNNFLRCSQSLQRA